MTDGSIGWVDATGGVSGDMLLGCCFDAGVSPELVQRTIDSLSLPEHVSITQARVQRQGLAASHAIVEVGASHHHRTLPDVLMLLAPLEARVREQSEAVFRTLAAAEAKVHGVSVDEVHFHEVGALDSIADVVGVCAAMQSLDIDHLTCSHIGLGGGRVTAAHGRIPVPGPAVMELLKQAQIPGRGGPVDIELATPTGVALLAVLADAFGPMPAMVPSTVAMGAGTNDPAGHPNVTRLVIGRAGAAAGREQLQILEANIDDLDPRLWPQILIDLIANGARDAWLTPILMKKGRPAHTLSVLSDHDKATLLESKMLTNTSTIGIRRHAVDRTVLPRRWTTVTVLDSPIRVKLASHEGRTVNAVPEYDDIEAVARTRGVSMKSVLAAAIAAAESIRGIQ